MRSHLACVALAILVTAARGQYLAAYDFLRQPPTFGELNSAPQQYNRGQPHPAVVENSIRESQLPEELLNHFYKNPNIAGALAKESWFGDKEFPVHHRDADKIPRAEIAKIVKRIQQHR